jgi:hypothetical protein
MDKLTRKHHEAARIRSQRAAETSERALTEAVGAAFERGRASERRRLSDLRDELKASGFLHDLHTQALHEFARMIADKAMRDGSRAGPLIGQLAERAAKYVLTDFRPTHGEALTDVVRMVIQAYGDEPVVRIDLPPMTLCSNAGHMRQFARM